MVAKAGDGVNLGWYRPNPLSVHRLTSRGARRWLLVRPMQVMVRHLGKDCSGIRCASQVLSCFASDSWTAGGRSYATPSSMAERLPHAPCGRATAQAAPALALRRLGPRSDPTALRRASPPSVAWSPDRKR